MTEHDADLKTQLADLKKLKQYVPLVFPIVSIGALLLLLVKILLPETFSVRQKFEKLDQDKAKIVQLEKKSQVLDEFGKETLINLIDKSQTLIPTGNDLAPLLIYLQELEERSAVVIDNIKFKSVDADLKKEKAAAQIKLRLKLIGGKEQLYNFFRLMSDPNRRILSVEELSLKTKDEQTTQANAVYNADLVIVAPYKSFPTKVGSVEQELPELTDAQRAILDQIALITAESSASESSTPAIDFAPREDPFRF